MAHRPSYLDAGAVVDDAPALCLGTDFDQIIDGTHRIAEWSMKVADEAAKTITAETGRRDGILGPPDQSTPPDRSGGALS